MQVVGHPYMTVNWPRHYVPESASISDSVRTCLGLLGVDPTACEKQCTWQQKTLATCVDSIRTARAAGVDNIESADVAASSDLESVADAPACLPIAVAAWTKCCEVANMREKEQATMS